jgi:hypothetical protein
MEHKRLLIETQLSNYNTYGKFLLECDSGWQMVMGRVREMLKLNPDLHIDVMCPKTGDPAGRQVITDPRDVNADLWAKYGEDGERRLNFIEHEIIANALVTRYDFNWSALASALDLGMQKIGKKPKWDAVYINDPMHLRNFKALFHVTGGYRPRFYVHSHFVDVPSCPKFPEEASLWFGQLEAAIKADWNFWQCPSALKEFEREADNVLKRDIVNDILMKSDPWDDGYSAEEINSKPDMSNVRFDPDLLNRWHAEGKVILFVPNRVGGRGRSSDYTNCGKFMFDILPKLRELRQDFVVLAGNPSQKFFNHELEKECGPNGYVSLVPDAFNRDEFKVICRQADIAVSLYDQDTYGGTAARECIELGCMPLWIDNFEYSSIAQEASKWPFLASPDFKDLHHIASALIHNIKERPAYMKDWLDRLRTVVRARCSYEATTPMAMKRMDLL